MNNNSHTLDCQLVTPIEADNAFESPNCIERIEQKYDLFHHDMVELLDDLDDRLDTITRDHETTATIHFRDQAGCEHTVDFKHRLRGYGDFAVGEPCPIQVQESDWKFEKKTHDRKRLEGYLEGLNGPCPIRPEAVFVKGRPFFPNTLKLANRRHYALACTRDETQRLTCDLARSLYRFEDRHLIKLGDMGPRIEIKTPVHCGDAAYDWLPKDVLFPTMRYSSLSLYMQNVLRSKIGAHTHAHLDELETKFMVTSGCASDLLNPLINWLENSRPGFRFLLPQPMFMSRMRRYHVCAPDSSGSSPTIVETPAGRCSVKTKRNAQIRQNALTRETRASHSTDIDGVLMCPEHLADMNDLDIVNSFVKKQLKVPVYLPSGIALQFTLDECLCRNGQELHQLEVEFIGDVNGYQHAFGDVLRAMDGVNQGLENSAIGARLRPTHMSKHQFFSDAA